MAATLSTTITTPLVILNDDDLQRISGQNGGYRLEREEDGRITMSPTFTNGGAKSGEAFGQLRDYAKRVGGKAYDSSTGFKIGPKLRTRSPDASWVDQSQIDELRRTGANVGYWPISPPIVVEVKSESDDFSETVGKIGDFRTRGTRYAVAIDQDTREVRELGERPEDLHLDFDAIIDA